MKWSNTHKQFVGDQPLRSLKGYGLLKQFISLQIFQRLIADELLECVGHFVELELKGLRLIKMKSH